MLPPRWAARLGTTRWKAIATIGLVALLALVAGAVWLVGRDTSDALSAEPAPPAAETQGEVAAIGEDTPSSESPEDQPPGEVGVHDAGGEASTRARRATPRPSRSSRVSRARWFGSMRRPGEILARLAIPSPKLLASDGRSVWVFSDDEPGDRLIRIDAATNAVTDSFDADVSAAGGEAATEGFPPNQLAVAGGSAWLSVDWGPLYRFTPGANAGEAAPLSGSVCMAGRGGGLALGPNRGGRRKSPARVDPVAGRILAGPRTYRPRGGGRSRVRVGARRPRGPNPGLVRIDTETNAVAPLGDAPGWPWLDYDFAVADGALWASGPQPGTIVRLDPVTGEVEGEIDVVPSPGPIAAGGGAVWAASRNAWTEAAYPSSSNGTLARYDIETGRVERIVVGGAANDLVFARGSVWVAVPELDSAGSLVPVDWGLVGTDRLLLTVDRVPFSFSLQAGDSWERFGSTSINKYISGGQDAEAIIFWNTLPSDKNTNRCAPLVGASLADLAAAVASAPGTELVAGPSDVTVGGRAAKHVVLTVREDVGCDPGFFFTWPAWDGGAFWLETVPGDTIRVWIVDVDGTHFVIEAETQPEAGSEIEQVEQEIQQFVDSIRFEAA